MNFRETFIGFFRKEIRQTLRDPRMRLLLFIVPLVQLTLFTIALSTEIKNIRLAAVFQPSDTVATEIYERALASGYFLKTTVKGSDPYQWIANNQADAVLITGPQGLTDAVAQGHGEVQLLIDAKSVLKAAAVENYLKVVMAKALKDLNPGTVAPLGGLQFDVRALYNPTLETSVFMIPGLICMLVCIVTILLTSMSIAKEREMGTLETLISAPVRNWEILLGKTVPFIFLGAVQVTLVILLAVFVFNLPLRGSIALLAISSLIFVLNTVSIGTLISTFSKTQQQAMMGGFIFLFPGVLMSGLFFPIESMPLLLKIVAWVNPMSHYIALLRNLMIKGTSLEFFALHCSSLLVTAFVWASVALKKFKTTL